MRRFGVYNRALTPRGKDDSYKNQPEPVRTEEAPEQGCASPPKDSYGLTAIKHILQRHSGVRNGL